MDIKKLVRPNILALKPYSCARTEFTGNASAFLDANENPFDSGFNRYPDPFQWKVKEKIAAVKHTSADRIFLGNGSDEAIDLLFRIFCDPRKDNVVAPNPTYGMYQVCAEINDVEYRAINLKDDFSLDAKAMLDAVDGHTKLMFICSPNNPTGNLIDEAQILCLLNEFSGIIVVDEAYIDFASRKSLIDMLGQYPNLVVLQTFSKAWGQASVRLGMAFASKEIIGYYNNVKYPYNINILAQHHLLEILSYEDKKNKAVEEILSERSRLYVQLAKLPVVEKLFDSDSNFILARVKDADAVYKYLIENGVVVRNRNKVALCAGCLRLTVGTADENNQLVELLSKI